MTAERSFSLSRGPRRRAASRVAAPRRRLASTRSRAPGASAQDLLAASSYDSLIVQVQYVQGFQPTAQGLQNLQSFLAARLNKPAGS